MYIRLGVTIQPVDEAPAQPYRHSERERRLLRRALTPVDTSAGLMARVKAIESLVRLQVPVPQRRIERALEDIRGVGEEIASYQALQAAAKAERLLDACFGPDERDWPSDTPREPVDRSDWDWLHWPDDLVDVYDVGLMSKGEMDTWRTELVGPPPWPREPPPG